MQLSRGQRIPLADLVGAIQPFSVEVSLDTGAVVVDAACFGLDKDRKLSDERYMTFFNQPATPCGGVRVERGVLAFDLVRLPEAIAFLAITLAVDGEGTLAKLGECAAYLRCGEKLAGVFPFSGEDFAGERAVTLVEIYRKDGAWRLSATAQGFDGGLDALVRNFGGTVAEPTWAPSSRDRKLSLEKRVESDAPQLVSLLKKARLSLEKAGLGAHCAKVCLCLDISGSMRSLYSSGAVQAFAERILALACRFDDDGEVDVFLFGRDAHHPDPMTLANCRDYIAAIVRRYPLEGDTRYGRAMKSIREFYFGAMKDRGGGGAAADMPVYVMFVTDGGTSDMAVAERQLKDSSHEPIFWQFMGIGAGRKSKDKRLADYAGSDFPFLEKMDELPDRLLDNANYFSVLHPAEHDDDALYDLLMTEYPDWVRQARQHGLIN